MDTEKQRQCRRDDARLTESGHARSEQLNTRGAYRVANQQSLACLSGSERRRPGWFLDMKYQICFKLKIDRLFLLVRSEDLMVVELVLGLLTLLVAAPLLI